MKQIIFPTRARNQMFLAQGQIIQILEWDAVIITLLLLQLMDKYKK